MISDKRGKQKKGLTPYGLDPLIEQTNYFDSNRIIPSKHFRRILIDSLNPLILYLHL